MAQLQKRTLGEVGTVKLFENPQARVWNLILEPGEASPWHSHDLNYITVVLEGERLRREDDDGRSEDLHYKVGDVNWRVTGTHRVINIGKTRFKNVIIELKR